jgi:hypothetical protein
MKLITSLQSGKQYGIELHERNYPKFEGRYNAYITVYGELSEQYIGKIEEPLKLDVCKDEIYNLANLIPDFIANNNYKISNW